MGGYAGAAARVVRRRSASPYGLRLRIVVNAGLPANAQVRVLVHELAHALGVGYQQFGRARAEVVVDTVTVVGCSAVGLAGGRRVDPICGWPGRGWGA
jgi:hypothetical protein